MLVVNILAKSSFGDYRIIADIEDEAITILVVTIGHGKDVYR